MKEEKPGQKKKSGYGNDRYGSAPKKDKDRRPFFKQKKIFVK